MRPAIGARISGILQIELCARHGRIGAIVKRKRRQIFAAPVIERGDRNIALRHQFFRTLVLRVGEVEARLGDLELRLAWVSAV